MSLTIERQILSELAESEPEYLRLVAATKRCEEVRNRRYQLISAYEHLCPDVTGDASERAAEVLRRALEAGPL